MKARLAPLLVVILLMCLVAGLRVGPTRAQDATATLPPTNTPRPTYAPTLVEVATPGATPTLAATVTPIPARICSDCSRIRLRSTPGTAGSVLGFLDDTATFLIVGRSDDAAWVKIDLQSGVPQSSDPNATSIPNEGWISAQYVRTPDDQAIDSAAISALPVLDTAVEASPAPNNGFAIPAGVSGVTAHAREIYLHGQSLGNHPNVFSRVGDSITVSPYFLTPIGQGNYGLGPYGSLADVIGYFSQATARTGNSFVNTSLAAGGGWSAFTLLLPGYSEPKLCGKDSPLVCEYKLVKPSIALIMVGTNDSGSGSVDQFTANLHQIVQISIDMGVIPAISTIPPKRINDIQSARVDAFNAVIRATAQQYNVPLWDYYTAMTPAPNEGLSSDGLHPSFPPGGASAHFSADNLQYGFTIRNLLALQMLDVLWRSALY